MALVVAKAVVHHAEEDEPCPTAEGYHLQAQLREGHAYLAYTCRCIREIAEDMNEDPENVYSLNNKHLGYFAWETVMARRWHDTVRAKWRAYWESHHGAAIHAALDPWLIPDLARIVVDYVSPHLT